jgi:hypothetical protein
LNSRRQDEKPVANGQAAAWKLSVRLRLTVFMRRNIFSIAIVLIPTRKSYY